MSILWIQERSVNIMFTTVGSKQSIVTTYFVHNTCNMEFLSVAVRCLQKDPCHGAIKHVKEVALLLCSLVHSLCVVCTAHTCNVFHKAVYVNRVGSYLRIQTFENILEEEPAIYWIMVTAPKYVQLLQMIKTLHSFSRLMVK